jgi:hypothetical protein
VKVRGGQHHAGRSDGMSTDPVPRLRRGRRGTRRGACQRPRKVSSGECGKFPAVAESEVEDRGSDRGDCDPGGGDVVPDATAASAARCDAGADRGDTGTGGRVAMGVGATRRRAAAAVAWRRPIACRTRVISLRVKRMATPAGRCGCGSGGSRARPAWCGHGRVRRRSGRAGCARGLARRASVRGIPGAAGAERRRSVRERGRGRSGNGRGRFPRGRWPHDGTGRADFAGA